MLSMTSSDAATSAHCVVMAQSLRHRKPWIFNASKGSSRSAKSPRAEVRKPTLLLLLFVVVEIVVLAVIIFWRRRSNRHERKACIRVGGTERERERERQRTHESILE